MIIAQNCLIHGKSIPADLLGELRETKYHPDNTFQLRERLQQDGYLFLRGLLSSDDVQAAREEIFGRLAEVGEIKLPVNAGISTGTSRRNEMVEDLGQFWQSVSEGPALRCVSHGQQTYELMSSIFGEAAQPHDYIFLRTGVVGRATNFHYDHPFFARGSKQIHTVWTALRDIPVCDGPLVIVEGSHRFTDLVEQTLKIDCGSDDAPLVSISGGIELAQQRQTRLLTADFQPGDVVIFGMTLLHGSLDNHSTSGHTRLSCDVRWQPAADPIDPRYAGPDPTGTTGGGYSELNGAKPLNEPWHVR